MRKAELKLIIKVSVITPTDTRPAGIVVYVKKSPYDRFRRYREYSWDYSRPYAEWVGELVERVAKENVHDDFTVMHVDSRGNSDFFVVF